MVTALSWVKIPRPANFQDKLDCLRALREAIQQEPGLSLILHPFSFSSPLLLTINFFLVTTVLAASFEPSARGT